MSFSVGFYNLSCESEGCKHYNGADGTDVMADRSWKKRRGAEDLDEETSAWEAKGLNMWDVYFEQCRIFRLLFELVVQAELKD